MLQMSQLRTKCQFLLDKFAQLLSLPNEVNCLITSLVELYVQLSLSFVNMYLKL